MPVYAALCTIDSARLDLFAALRAEHYAFLSESRERIRFGGPLRLRADGPPDTMIVIFDAEDDAAAHAFIAREPYNAAGGFGTVRIGLWSQVLPEPAPGSLLATLAQERARRAGAE